MAIVPGHSNEVVGYGVNCKLERNVDNDSDILMTMKYGGPPQ